MASKLEDHLRQQPACQPPSRNRPSRSGWPDWGPAAQKQEEGGKMFDALVKGRRG